MSRPTSSATSSTRALPTTTIPSLATLCARVFVANFCNLRRNTDTWNRVSLHLTALPAAMISKVAVMLQISCPTYLPHEFIVTYLFRGPSITLSRDLPGVKKRTILAIPRINADIRELELSDFADITDSALASVLQHLSKLTVLVLRGSTKVGGESVRAVAKSCHELRVLNLNYTSVPPISLISLVASCRHLEVLKLAGMKNWTDSTFATFTAGLKDDLMLLSLRSLKFRQTSLSDASLDPFLKKCPALQQLDISFTSVRHPSALITPGSSPFALQKLSLTSTNVSAADVIATLRILPELRTLALGALGGSYGPRSSGSSSATMTMSDETLRTITDILEPFQYLESISLVGNTKLGSSSKGALSYFIARVGRKCKKVNLAGIPTLRSSDLSGLMSADVEGVSPLEILNLNNTGIDDEAGVYLGSCTELGTLELAGTRVTREGLLVILDSCRKLTNLDLTSCRGVKLAERRQFFEVWEATRVQNQVCEPVVGIVGT